MKIELNLAIRASLRERYGVHWAVLLVVASVGACSWLVSRGVRRTYGCDTYLVFEPARDPEAKKVWNADRQRFDCKDRFSVFVTSGQVIESDQKVTNLYYPTLKNQTQMKFNFFSTAQTSVRYIDEDHVRRSGATVARLETNRTLTEAIALYRSAGYEEVAPFNDEPFAHHWFAKSLV